MVENFAGGFDGDDNLADSGIEEEVEGGGAGQRNFPNILGLNDYDCLKVCILMDESRNL